MVVDRRATVSRLDQSQNFSREIEYAKAQAAESDCDRPDPYFVSNG
jgi:hypothetical protein